MTFLESKCSGKVWVWLECAPTPQRFLGWELGPQGTALSSEVQGWGNGLVSNMFHLVSIESEFEPRTYVGVKNLAVVVHICNLSAGEAETGRSWDSAASQ